jgi:4-hydroxythreonine-4-phosphate dehydrogenase
MKGEIYRIALTPGEPAGIGPDICIQAAQRPQPAAIVAIADPDLLRARARRLGLPLILKDYQPGSPARIAPAGTLEILPERCANRDVCGEANPVNADYILKTLRRAVHGCCQREFAAMVTGPVNKGIINSAGISFTGHTEFLAEITGTPHVVMMLATPGLRVALVTTHLALKDIFREITRERVEITLRITHDNLRKYFCIPAPHLLVCGLNPHAGEGGNLGREEIEIINPVIEKLKVEGLRITGPKPADTSFLPADLDTVDVVVSMYHDQGLPVLKHMGFGRAINVTLGLPLIRTSVDHGTAFELAGSGRADTGSLEAALLAAVEMARNSAQAGRLE